MTKKKATVKKKETPAQRQSRYANNARIQDRNTMVTQKAMPDAILDRKAGGGVTGDWPTTRPADVDIFAAVRLFHDKMGLPRDRLPETVERGGPPRLLTAEEYQYRYKFLVEELNEFQEAHLNGDIAQAAGELLDLVWVAIGTIYYMRVEPECLWQEIERANMTKRRAVAGEVGTKQETRGKLEKIVKPKDFVPPRLTAALSKMRQLWYGKSQLDGGEA